MRLRSGTTGACSKITKRILHKKRNRASRRHRRLIKIEPGCSARERWWSTANVPRSALGLGGVAGRPAFPRRLLRAKQLHRSGSNTSTRWRGSASLDGPVAVCGSRYLAGSRTRAPRHHAKSRARARVEARRVARRATNDKPAADRFVVIGATAPRARPPWEGRGRAPRGAGGGGGGRGETGSSEAAHCWL